LTLIHDARTHEHKILTVPSYLDEDPDDVRALSKYVTGDKYVWLLSMYECAT